MTPEELGDTLARLVWESFSDFVSDDDAEIPLGALGVPNQDGVPEAYPAEEALIFLMWAHTRGVQLAFLGRARDDLVKLVSMQCTVRYSRTWPRTERPAPSYLSSSSA